jgi:acetyl esterase
VLNRPVLLYDGTCGFCLGWVERIRRWDTAGTIALVPAGSREIYPELLHLSDRALHEAMHLVLPDGRVFAGGDAVPEVLRLLPVGRWVVWIFGIPGVRWLTRRVYRWVAARRHRLGCQVPRQT